MSILLAKKGFRVVAVDGSEEMLSIARKNSEKEQCDHLINYQFQNLSDFTGFVKKHKDLTSIVICSSVIEYLENPEKILKQIFQLLKPGGITLITFPNKYSFYRIYERLKKYFRLIPNNHYLKYQKNQFYLDLTKELMIDIGFHILYHEYLNFSNDRLKNIKPEYNASMFIIVASKSLDI